MRYCTKCGEELPEDAKFCPKCGTAVKTLDKFPSTIELTLARDEKVLNSFKLSFNSEVYLTNRKLLVKKGEDTQSIHYGDITSVHYKQAVSSWPALIAGALSLALGMIESSALLYFLAGLSFLLLIVIEVLPLKRLEITILGVKKPIKIEGEKKVLESLMKMIEEKRASRVERRG